MGLVDGNGEVVWEKLAHHFESVDIGTISASGEVGIYVDIDHLPRGESLGHLYNLDGDLLGIFHFFYGRHHRMLDWTGNGVSEIVLGNAATIVDVEGNQVTLDKLCRTEPEWAVNRMSVMDVEARNAEIAQGLGAAECRDAIRELVASAGKKSEDRPGQAADCDDDG